MAGIPRRRGVTVAVGLSLAGALVLAGCAKGEDDDKSSDDSTNTAAAQQVQSTGASGPGCTYTKYGAPKLDLKNTTVGFSQSEATSNPFRATETKSITAEAKRLGIKLIQRNANANVAQQNTDIQGMIAQGAKALIVAPENSDGLAPALKAARAKKIPVLTVDRTVQGTQCKDFVGFIGSDFTGQAVIAANDLAGAIGRKGDVAVLQGTSGNNVAQERTKGFVDTIKSKYRDVKIVASQTANFDQATGQKVAAQILQKNPKLKGIYAENDTMALGAITAIRAAGKKPGTDIKVVAIDGIRQAVQYVASGIMHSDIETNPRFGPLAFKALKDFYGTTGVQAKVIIEDQHFTKANAAQALKEGRVY